MNYFICDIVGTYNGAKHNREEEIVKFVNNLNKIIELENLNELIFCFESSDNMEFVKTYVDEFSKYIKGTKIKMGLQFSGNEYMEDGIIKSFNGASKTEQTVFLLTDKIINNIYLADDLAINHEMTSNFLHRLLLKKHKEIYGDSKKYISYNKLIHFMPGTEIFSENSIGNAKKGLDALNQILEKYIGRIKLERTI